VVERLQRGVVVHAERCPPAVGAVQLDDGAVAVDQVDDAHGHDERAPAVDADVERLDGGRMAHQ
jgi:hypothetical protein